MRNKEYIATVVNQYRKSLNKLKGQSKAHLNNKSIYNKNNHYINHHNLHDNYHNEDLKLVFNRGFTSGHILTNNSDNIIGRKKSGHIGLFIGEIVNFTDEKK